MFVVENRLNTNIKRQLTHESITNHGKTINTLAGKNVVFESITLAQPGLQNRIFLRSVCFKKNIQGLCSIVKIVNSFYFQYNNLISIMTN